MSGLKSGERSSLFPFRYPMRCFFQPFSSAHLCDDLGFKPLVCYDEGGSRTDLLLNHGSNTVAPTVIYNHRFAHG